MSKLNEWQCKYVSTDMSRYYGLKFRAPYVYAKMTQPWEILDHTSICQAVHCQHLLINAHKSSFQNGLSFFDMTVSKKLNRNQQLNVCELMVKWPLPVLEEHVSSSVKSGGTVFQDSVHASLISNIKPAVDASTDHNKFGPYYTQIMHYVIL